MLGVEVLVRQLPGCSDLGLPVYLTNHSAGADLRAAIVESITIDPGETARIPLGFEVAIPEGYEAQIRSRSGIASQHAVTVLNAPATIDADFRGPLEVLLINHGHAPFLVARGDRIAQLVIAPVVSGIFRMADSLPTTERDDGGFGSTGR